MTGLIHNPARYSVLLSGLNRGWAVNAGELLRSRGVSLFRADTSPDALRVVENEIVHLAVLDMHLAPLDGLETLRVIRTMKPELPCILVSRRTTDRDLQRALSLHAFSVFDEPLDPALLQAQLGRVFFKFYRSALF